MEAQYYLGFTYTEETGDPADERIALKWFTRAAEHGNEHPEDLHYEASSIAVEALMKAFPCGGE